MGVSGSGKSTVGVALARRLGVPFADADGFHPQSNIAKMAGGTPLTDDDRHQWLQACGQWLAQHTDGGVLSCSALKRRYRDQLRCNCAGIEFLHLTGSPEVIGRRQASRPGHFMPATLLQSQFATLEPLGPDEHGMALDVDESVESIVETFVRYLAKPRRR
jgi:gluconokinase